MIQLRLHIHENYTQSCVRIYEENRLLYTEYSFNGHRTPLDLFTTGTSESKVPKEDEPLQGFDGVFDLTMEKDTDKWFVVEARCLSLNRGARVVTDAFRDPQFGERTLLNLFSALADKDVDKLNTIMKALRAASGETKK